MTEPSPYDFAQACLDWRKATLALATDPTIDALEIAVDRLQEQLAAAKLPYREAVERAADNIRSYVTVTAESAEMHGVKVQYKAGKRTPRWKEIAQIYAPPAEVIEAHTSVGEPSVSISLA